MTQARERTATLSELVAEEIRALLARRRMSGRQLAGQLGVSPSWVSYRLTGTQPIDLNDLQRIASALGVPAIELLPASVRKVNNGPDEPNVRWDLLLLTDTAASPDKPPRHVATRPFGPTRTDSTRPASVIAPNRRRPTPVRPDSRRTMPS